jgi:2-polyprenyl-3-methyl-5-hydroxy-6-metoxy-1,4-benzoquinol methylase
MLPAAQTDPFGFETLEVFSQASAINRWLYEKISGHVQGNVLEIGSGIGNISTFILKSQPVVSLSDLRPEYCRLLEKKFGHDPHLKGVYELDLSDTNFESVHANLIGKFDTVIALNVIEHIEDDLLAIRNAKSLLGNEGILIVLVPAGQWLYNQLDKELGHFKRYTKNELKNLMKLAGFRISDSRFFNAAAILGWWFSGKILREKTISAAKLNLFNQLVPLFRITDFFAAPFAGISVISVGIKN